MPTDTDLDYYFLKATELSGAIAQLPEWELREAALALDGAYVNITQLKYTGGSWGGSVYDSYVNIQELWSKMQQSAAAKRLASMQRP